MVQPSPPEADKAANLVPNLDDSPTEYKSKLDQAVRTAQSGVMRDKWLMNNGSELSDKTRSSINVTDMPKFYKEQAIRHAEQLKSQGIDESEANQRTLQWLGQMFGIVPKPEYFR